MVRQVARQFYRLEEVHRWSMDAEQVLRQRVPHGGPIRMFPGICTARQMYPF